MVFTDIISKVLSWQSKNISDVTVSDIQEAFLKLEEEVLVSVDKKGVLIDIAKDNA